jgi:polysaccharide biosynthesis transport protein
MAQYDLNLVDFWLIVRRRKFIVLLTVGLVGSMTSTMPYLVGPPPVYKAAARVKYERSTTASGLLQESISGVGGESDIATQAEVIKSFNVMENVAKGMELIDKSLESKDIRANHELLDVIYDIQGHVEAAQEGSTNIIKITATAGDPRTAERYATLTADAYREENIYNRNRQVIEARAGASGIQGTGRTGICHGGGQTGPRSVQQAGGGTRAVDAGQEGSDGPVAIASGEQDRCPGGTEPRLLG